MGQHRHLPSETRRLRLCHRHDWRDSSAKQTNTVLAFCRLGVDAIKFVRLGSNYLPKISKTGGWSSMTTVSNNSASLAHVSVTEFASSGSYLGRQIVYIPAYSSQTIIPYNSTVSSIVVDATQDASAVVELFYNGAPAAYNGLTQASGPGSSGWERAGNTLYVPLVKNNFYGRSSNIFVTNAGSQTTTISVTYYNTSGSSSSGGNFSLSPNQQKAAHAHWLHNRRPTLCRQDKQQQWPAFGGHGAGRRWQFAGRAARDRITLSAAAIRPCMPHWLRKTSMNTRPVSLSRTLAQERRPMFKHCIAMTAVPVPIPLTSRFRRGAPYVLIDPSQIPDGFLGSVRLISTNGQPLVAQMTESNVTFGGDRRMMSNLLLSGTYTVILPLWYDRYNVYPLNGDWRSGVTIRNVGVSSASVTAPVV